ncbi:hypothetical protein [Nocardia alni]|uniref:hypothetical protein n=1 Tax=Nocardia alni TaxID=2815723 RepID=UPI001C246A55|nr:hypothetical protein [Nocardia alni]
MTTRTSSDLESEQDWEYVDEYGRSFRTVPGAVHEIHGSTTIELNLLGAITTTDYFDSAESRSM